jgi:tetratricopeptide (TPR) repeat protein
MSMHAAALSAAVHMCMSGIRGGAMENSNPRGADIVGDNRPSKERQLALGLILAVLAIGYGAYTLLGWYNAKLERKTGDDYAAFMAAAVQADAVADPLQRCLRYPDFPGSHWSDDTTHAYCQLRNRHTLKLTEIDDLLKQGKADEVDRIFKGYLDTQQHDATQPGMLDSAFFAAGFDDASDDTRRVIDTWKQQSPNSAFALAASGEQYVAAAHEARGSGWAKDLSDQQVQGMDRNLELARQDLEKAATLLPSVTPVYASMIDASGLAGDDGYMEQAASLGLKADSSNFNIRARMMAMSQPKWGGEFGGEEEQKSEDEALAGRNPLLRMVAQEPAAYRATCDCGDSPNEVKRLLIAAAGKSLDFVHLKMLADEAYDDNPRMAIELYSEVLRFDPTNFESLILRSQLMLKLGDKNGAINTIAEAVHRFPQNNDIADRLANIDAQAGKVKDAEDTYLGVLNRDPDNQEAMARLGDLYNHAGHQPEKAKLLSDTLISRHPENPAGYVVRSCYQMDHNLPGAYDTIHYFIDHFGDDPQWKEQTAEMRGYLVRHPEQKSS